MAAVRVNVIIEVDQKGNGLLIQTPVPIQLAYDKGKWRGQSQTPPLCTDAFDTMEEAVIAVARQVGDELQAAVIERPMIAGRIAPDMLPSGVF